MDTYTKERLDIYLDLLDEISEKTSNENIAIAILHEILKDKRSQKIREEKEIRNNELATEKQKQFMKKLKIDFPEDVTKKQASSLIDEELGKGD